MERELHCLPMARPMTLPIPDIKLPLGCRIISITEESGHLWETVMEDAYGEVFLPGTFRGVMVSHPYYHEDQVFVMLNEKDEPIATASAWQSDVCWHDTTYGSIIHVGVVHAYRGRKFGAAMVYYALGKLRRRGYDVADLCVEERNLSAIKTYLNCGFTPELDEPIEEAYWQEQFAALGLPPCGKAMRLRAPHEMPLPPRPWPYQLEYYAKAAARGQTYVYGSWYWHNLFHVSPAHYINLKERIVRSKYADELIRSIEEKRVFNIFVDKPVEPEALLVECEDGALYLIGKSYDPLFCSGIEEYLAYRCRAKFAKEGKEVRLTGDDFVGVAATPRIVEGLTYGAPLIADTAQG